MWTWKHGVLQEVEGMCVTHGVLAVGKLALLEVSCWETSSGGDKHGLGMLSGAGVA